MVETIDIHNGKPGYWVKASAVNPLANVHQCTIRGFDKNGAAIYGSHKAMPFSLPCHHPEWDGTKEQEYFFPLPDRNAEPLDTFKMFARKPWWRRMLGL